MYFFSNELNMERKRAAGSLRKVPLFLAFFPVVASNTNLSTSIRGKYRKYFEIKKPTAGNL
jgi:hypothetical protein